MNYWQKIEDNDEENRYNYWRKHGENERDPRILAWRSSTFLTRWYIKCTLYLYYLIGTFLYELDWKVSFVEIYLHNYLKLTFKWLIIIGVFAYFYAMKFRNLLEEEQESDSDDDDDAEEDDSDDEEHDIVDADYDSDDEDSDIYTDVIEDSLEDDSDS